MSDITNPTESSVRDELETLLRSAEERLEQAEAVAALVPQLRTEIKVLKRSLTGLTSSPTPRASSRRGPTIRERILSELEAAGGEITFEAGSMLTTVHDLVGGKASSVGVEIHRLENKTGQIEVDRNISGSPVALRLKPPAPLTVVPNPEQERLEG